MKEEARRRRTLNGYVCIKLTEEEQNSYFSQVSYTSDNWMGWAYEHRFVVEQDLGERLADNVIVHHINGDRGNNDISNLLPVVGKAAHVRLHKWIDCGAEMHESYVKNWAIDQSNTIGEKNTCLQCGKPTNERRNKYCSLSCTRKSQEATKDKPARPSMEDLASLLKTNSFLSVGKMFGVSDNAIRKWCKGHGLDPKKVKDS